MDAWQEPSGVRKRGVLRAARGFNAFVVALIARMLISHEDVVKSPKAETDARQAPQSVAADGLSTSR